MNVIALRGNVDTGKSHVINIVYQFALKSGWKQVPGHFRILGNPKFEDIIDILSKDDRLLGFIGAGDYQIGDIGVGNLLKELYNKGCDVVVCSCRTNHKIEKAISNYTNHTWVQKTLSTGKENDRIVNGIDAKTIFNLI
jgi:hypothetical protein